MNRIAVCTFAAVVFYLGGTSTSFSSMSVNDKTPHTKDLSLQEMSSVVGSGRMYWRTMMPLTLILQYDGHLHQRVVSGWRNAEIGGHDIQVGQRVVAGCQGLGGPLRRAQFVMPNRDVSFFCN